MARQARLEAAYESQQGQRERLSIERLAHLAHVNEQAAAVFLKQRRAEEQKEEQGDGTPATHR